MVAMVCEISSEGAWKLSNDHIEKVPGKRNNACHNYVFMSLLACV